MKILALLLATLHAALLTATLSGFTDVLAASFAAVRLLVVRGLHDRLYAVQFGDELCQLLNLFGGGQIETVTDTADFIDLPLVGDELAAVALVKDFLTIVPRFDFAPDEVSCTFEGQCPGAAQIVFRPRPRVIAVCGDPLEFEGVETFGGDEHLFHRGLE